jgi:CheY-like chemotaxis protein
MAGRACETDAVAEQGGMATHPVELKRRFVRIVLAIDGPEAIRAACERIAGDPGIVVVATAGSGFAALVAVDVLHPDLVLLDVSMPGIGGVEATRRIKSRPDPPAVVLVTLHDPAELEQQAREAGADALISRRELNESVESVMRALAGC